MKTKTYPESELQKKVVAWFRKYYPKYLLFAISNEASYKRASHFRAMGMLPGVSDTIMVLPDKILFLEFKDIHGRQSDHQKQFQVKIELLGFEYHIIRDLQDVKQILRNNLPISEWVDL